MSESVFLLLATQTAQITLLAIVVWISVRLFARDRPHLAHALWLLVLLKCLTPPIFASPTGAFSWLPPSGWNSTFVAEATREGTAEQETESDFVASTNSLSAEQNKTDFGIDIVTPNIKSSQLPDVDSSITTEPSLDAFSNSNVTDVRLKRFGSEPIDSTKSMVNNKPFLSWDSWAASVITGWVLISGFCVAMSVIRLTLFMRWAGQGSSAAEPELTKFVGRLRRQLGIRRRVQVRLLARPIGPAVTGLFRPTILLPASIVKQISASQLQPLLAHELIHIRRGDLWWALIQNLAKCLFWFHPLVQFAARMQITESERSCDEETVACLGCTPAEYARSLIEILEHKQRLRTAPSLPGVRPVDITKTRLERVMKFENGIQKTTPAWVWLVLVIGGLVTLPGASFALLQESGKAPKDGTERHNIVATTTQSVQSYPVSSVLELWNATATSKDFTLAQFLELPYTKSGQFAPTSTSNSIQFQTAEKTLKFGGDHPRFQLVGETLYVFGSPKMQVAVQADLNRYNTFGFGIVVVDSHMIQIPRNMLGDLNIDWSIAPVAANGVFAQDPNQQQPGFLPDDNRDELFELAFNQSAATLIGTTTTESSAERINTATSQSAGQQDVAATSFVQRNSPVLYSMVDRDGFKRVLETIKAMANAKMLANPKLVTHNGTAARIRTGAEVPFVVGVEKITDGKATAHNPVIQIVRSGLTLDVLPVADPRKDKPDETIQLTCRLETNEILDVDVVGIPSSASEQEKQAKSNQPETETGISVQVPNIATTRIRGTFDVPKEKTLILASLQKNKDGESEMSLTFISCRKLDGGVPIHSYIESQHDKPSDDMSFPSPPIGSNTKGGKAGSESQKTQEDSSKVELNEEKGTWSGMSFRSNVPVKEGPDSYTIEDDQSPLYGLRIQGSARIEQSEDDVVISGREIEIASDDGDFLARAESVRLTVLGSDDASLELEGKASIKIEENITLQADKVRYGTTASSHNLQFDLKGHCLILFRDLEYQWQGQADSIALDDQSGNVILTGRVRFERSGQSPRRITADRIVIDSDTGTVISPDSIPGENEIRNKKNQN